MRVDVAVIGAGTAGLAAYRAVTKRGKSAVLIESGPYGTTCARVGCMPSKLLIAAADAAHHARHAAPFGVRTTVDVDGRAVMKRVRDERDRFVGFVLESVDRIPEEHRLRGHARFIEPHGLDVDGVRIDFATAVVATGSSPIVPPMFDVVKERLIVNDDVFAWNALPTSVAVFGSGVIGLELGQALARLGVRTHVFGRNYVLAGLTDPRVREAALRALREELPIEINDAVRHVRLAGNGPVSTEGIVVEFADAQGTMHTEKFEWALIAAGRRPNLKDLDLDYAGVSFDGYGLPVFDRRTMQCVDSPIFIAGDADSDVPLLHEATDEGTIAGDNAATYPAVTEGSRRSLLAIAFTEPNIAIVGASFGSLRESQFVTGEISFEDQGRSRIILQNRGRAHVYADTSSRETWGRFLGAELAGPRAEHIAHLLAWCHQQRLTIDQMLRMPFYHPVIEEGLRTALRDASAKLHAQLST